MFRRVSIRLALIAGDMAAIIIALVGASWLRPQLEFGKPIPAEDVWLDERVYLLTLLVWSIGFLVTDVYNLRKNLRPIDEIQRLIAAHAITSLAFAGTLYFSFRDISRLQVLVFVGLSLGLLLLFRVVFRFLLQLFGDKRYGSRRVLIVGANSVGHRAAQMIEQNSWTGLKLVGFIDDDPQADTLDYPHFGPLAHTPELVQTRDINEVILVLPRQAHTQLANLVAELQSLKVNVRVVPDYFDLVFLRSVVEDLGDIPLVTLKEPALDPLQRLTKRSFDVVFATVSFVLSLPLMALIAIAIRLDTPGNIIFKQQRVGENGELFDMYKFRTMIQDAEAQRDEVIKINGDGLPLHKFYDDPRVTNVGRFLRRTSLDELPQFINVIKGDMSLVGPRPELPWLVEKYEPWQRKRFEVPQGLTGWWQVNGRSDKPMHLHTQDDLYYIKNYSLWLDIRILWQTIKAVLSRRGSF